MIIDRYILEERHLVNGRVLPLREKGQLKDPWNLIMALSLVCLMFGLVEYLRL